MSSGIRLPASLETNTTQSSIKYDSSNFKGTMYDFTDPKRLGPGAWTYMHAIGMWANGDKLKEEHACEIFEFFCLIFKCMECNGHCNHHVLEVDPPRKYIGIPYGIFDWTVDFRNAVQKRLGRSNFYDLQTMRQIFSDKTFMACSEGCSEDSEKKQGHEPQAIQQPIRETVNNRTFGHGSMTFSQFSNPNIIDIYGGGLSVNELSRRAPSLIQPMGQLNITSRGTR